jgi:hypothetical protein
VDTDGHLRRLVRAAGSDDILQALTQRLSPSDLQSLLLEVMRRRAAAVRPARVLAQWQSNRFVRPSPISARLLRKLDVIGLELLEAQGFQTIELAPLVPLGTHSAVRATDQHRVISAVRSLEVVADSTNALAVEAAVRRGAALRGDPRDADPVRLATSQRQVRAQQYGDPGALAHFQLFGLVTAGRDTGSWRFERAALFAHVVACVGILHAARAAGFRFAEVRVTLQDLGDGVRAEPISAVRDDLAARFPDVPVRVEPAESDYYQDVRFRVDLITRAGEEFNIADGGPVSWTRSLLGNDKERLVIGGLGPELLAVKCAPAQGSDRSGVVGE